MDERKIDFALISSQRVVRGEGKTEKDRAKKKPGGASSKRRQAGKRKNFESDSTFRKEKGTSKVKPEKAGNHEKGAAKAKPEKAGSKEKKAKVPSDKTRKIAAATKAKRAAKKQATPE